MCVKKLLLQNFASAIVKFHIPLFASLCLNFSMFLCSCRPRCRITTYFFHFSIFNVCCGCRLRADYDDSSRLILFSCLSISPCPSDSPLYSVVPLAPCSLFTAVLQRWNIPVITEAFWLPAISFHNRRDSGMNNCINVRKMEVLCQKQGSLSPDKTFYVYFWAEEDDCSCRWKKIKNFSASLSLFSTNKTD